MREENALNERIERALSIRSTRVGTTLRHSVYTRLLYDDDARFSERLAFALQTSVPAMVGQSGHRCVRWAWYCLDRHVAKIAWEVRRAGWQGSLVFNTRDDTEDIQTALDSDDWVAPGYLAAVQAEGVRDQTGPRAVFWQPLRYDVKGRRWMAPRKLATWPSMFYSIYRPDARAHMYAVNHTLLAELLPVREAPEQGMVSLVVHGANMFTELKGTEHEVPAPSGSHTLRLTP